jgi:Xaa-Pro aminopeptidase
MGAVENRIKGLLRKMEEENLDAFLVLAEENRRFLSGFTGEDTQLDESAGALLIARDARILATDSRYETQARAECPDFDVAVYTRGLAKELPEILKRLSTRRLGFESRRITHELYTKIREELETAGLSSIELIAFLEMTDALRIRKEEDEIRAIREAVELAESAFSDFLENAVARGTAEKDAAWALEKRMREAGAQSVSFPVIAASGPNSALPHAIPGDRTFQAGEPLLFDFGARLNGYCSDMTRTVFLEKPDETFRKIFTIVHDAQLKAIETIRPGRSTREVDAAARDHIAAHGCKEYFGHGLGHGVGLAVHEAPSLSPVAEKEKILAENMVFTVEPGIYIPGSGGVRLENIVVVRSHGAEVLNRMPVPLDPLPL